MSILHRIPPAELERQFTHRGWFLGLVPVYLGDLDSDGPLVAERNWVPEWWFTLAEGLFGLFCTACLAVNPAFEPLFPILNTGPIKAKGGGS